MDARQTDRKGQLARFRTGYASLEAVLAEASDVTLDRRPADGGWTAREVVHHLADMEVHAYIRLRRLLVEDRPVLHVPDEPAYARKLQYDRPISASLAVVRAVRQSSLEILEGLTPEEWSRAGTHPKIGDYDIGRWLQIYSEHPHDHADQMRAAMGLPPLVPR